MLSFMLTGTVGKVLPRCGETEIAVSSARLLQSGETNINWVCCTARAQLLRSKIASGLKAGDIVRIHGEIEPRRREIKGVAFYDVVLVARWFEKLEVLPALDGVFAPGCEAQP
jgi:hypothetical protein